MHTTEAVLPIFEIVYDLKSEFIAHPYFTGITRVVTVQIFPK